MDKLRRMSLTDFWQAEQYGGPPMEFFLRQVGAHKGKQKHIESSGKSLAVKKSKEQRKQVVEIRIHRYISGVSRKENIRN